MLCSGQHYLEENIRNNYRDSPTIPGDTRLTKKICDTYHQQQHELQPDDVFQYKEKCYHPEVCHETLNQDKLSIENSDDNETSANYALNEALRTDSGASETTDIETEFAARLSENEGKVVCTLLVPDFASAGSGHHSDWDNNSCLPTPESDRDSGCFSLELEANKEKCVVSSVINDVVTNTIQCKIKRGRNNFTQPSFKIYGNKTFQRKVWKRRNGWYRVRNLHDYEKPEAEGCNIAECEQQGVTGQGVRSQLSRLSARQEETAAAEPSSHASSGEENTVGLLHRGDRQAAKEFEQPPAAVATTEIEKITVEQDLSDNDQELEIFPDTSDTIKANGDRGSVSGPTYDACHFSSLTNTSDIQTQLARMRLEIAKMVAEASELDYNSDDDEEEIDDVTHLEDDSESSNDSSYYDVDENDSDLDQ